MEVKDFINFLNNSLEKGLISENEKENYEYDCAVIQLTNPERLEELMSRIIECIKSGENKEG